jgi:hypothetical protein
MTQKEFRPFLLLAAVAAVLFWWFSIPNFVGNGMTKAVRRRMTCVSNLREIDAAKQIWAAAVHAPPNAIPNWEDLKPYLSLSKGEIPKCPAKGVYTIGSLTNLPTCSIKDHYLEW